MLKWCGENFENTQKNFFPGSRITSLMLSEVRLLLQSSSWCFPRVHFTLWWHSCYSGTTWSCQKHMDICMRLHDDSHHLPPKLLVAESGYTDKTGNVYNFFPKNILIILTTYSDGIALMSPWKEVKIGNQILFS